MGAVADKLREARALIEPEGAWVQGSYAYTASKRALITGSQEGAVCWCAVGAIDKSCQGEPRLWRKAADFLGDAVGCAIPKWNDAPERTHAEVLAAFDKAIELAEAQP